MDKYVNIGTPTLSPGDYFDVRYRKLPNGAWQDLGHINSQSFVINGLTDGSYILEITYVLADGTRCTPTTVSFDVDSDPPPPPVCDCIDVSEAYVSIDCRGVAKLNISFDTPYPDNCGIRLIYSFYSSPDVIVPYSNASLPSSLEIPIANANNVKVRIEVLCCETNQWITCYDSEIVDIRRCDCISPPEIINEDLTVNPNGTSKYCVTFIASNPDVSPYTITFDPTLSGTQVQTQVVQSAGNYCFNLPEGLIPTRGKWLVVVSNTCGQDSGNGL